MLWVVCVTQTTQSIWVIRLGSTVVAIFKCRTPFTYRLFEFLVPTCTYNTTSCEDEALNFILQRFESTPSLTNICIVDYTMYSIYCILVKHLSSHWHPSQKFPEHGHCPDVRTLPNHWAQRQPELLPFL